MHSLFRVATSFTPDTTLVKIVTTLLMGFMLLGSPAAFAHPPKILASANGALTDASLVYQILVGEIELNAGNVGTSYQVLLEAARKTKNEALFRRSTDIALQARAGDKALEAARAWQAALPDSTSAQRYLIDILTAMGRGAEVMEPLSALLKLSTPAERVTLINSTPRILNSTAQPEKLAPMLEEVFKPYANTADAGTDTNVALGRIWAAANEHARALEFAHRAHALNPLASEPALLAIELMGNEPQAAVIVEDYLRYSPNNLSLRLVFSRALTLTQRFTEAVAQLEFIAQQEPTLAAAWLALGTLQLELHNPKEAIIALQNFLDTTEALVPAGAAQEAHEADSDLFRTETSPHFNRQQARILLSKAAEQLGDHAAAQAWLNQVDHPRLAPDVIQRRVHILAKQGKLAEARKLIRSLSEQQADDRTKVLLETLVLREAKQWSEAQKVLSSANQRLPNDIELLYEQAMVEEKLNRLGDMERLLRRVIDLKPDHYNALNALGYTWADRNMRLPEAKTLIQRALALAPRDPFVMDSMAWVEYRMSNRTEALSLLRMAFKARPDPEIGAHLGELLWVTGERDEAMRVWRDGFKRDANNDVLKETLIRLKVDL